MSAGLHGKPIEPRRQTGTRPHAPLAGRKGIPTITGICGIFNMPGLPWASARETAVYAIHHAEELAALSTDEAIDKAYKHHRGLWDGRAAMGTLVHAVNEEWTWNRDIDVKDMIDALLAGKRPPRIWRGFEDEVAQDAMGYLDGLERFWDDWQPETLATEEVVRHAQQPNTYVGQRDWVADMRQQRWLLEIKCTAQQDAEKGVYADSWRMQLALQRWAELIVLYDANGNEEGTAPNYPVDRCGVVHLRGDGSYTLFELDTSMSVWTRALQARGLWSWLQKESKTPAPVAVPPPVREVVA